MGIKITVLTITLAGVFGWSCNPQPAVPATTDSSNASSVEASFAVETVVSNVEVPWALAWTPDGRMLFTERPGRVRVFENGKLRPEPLFTVPDVEPSGESGLMDLSLHPQFASNKLVYLTYAYKNQSPRVRVMRYRFEGDTLIEPKVIIEDIPAAQYHAGCRARFGPDGKLYITTGDATQRDLAQRLDSLAGKVLRLNDDGTVPPDNPFVQTSGARPEIWSYGHRNSQGIAWHPETKLLFETEHGPSGFDGPGGGDEVNIVDRGKNYGWPIIHHKETKEGLESPLLEYTPACAPASAMFVSKAVPGFTNNFLFGCLRGERLIRVVLEGRRILSQENLFEKKYGRIREVAQGPDGFIYFTTSNRDGRGKPAGDDDRIMRLVPAKAAKP